MTLNFYKYQGTGNDFVIADNRQQQYNNLTTQQVAQLCNRKFGIGADGVLLLNLHPTYDFEMVYYNADGNLGSMCGNGGRCMVRFANDIGIVKENYSFLAADGLHQATIDANNIIRLKMQDVDEINNYENDFLLNTGSPHYIQFVTDAQAHDVYNQGHAIRYSPEFVQEGVNVNFVQKINAAHIFVRTYERGVEAETLSCGTGVTAASLVSANNHNGFNTINVQTIGGNLAVEFNKSSTNNFTDIYLCGPATFVFKGSIEI